MTSDIPATVVATVICRECRQPFSITAVEREFIERTFGALARIAEALHWLPTSAP